METENNKFLRLLKQIDQDDDVQCNDFECAFLESVLTQKFPLTLKQQVIAERMINKYLLGE